jgi:pyridoxine 5-phosphate synthase
MRLGVNIDHVATIREARGGLEPDPVTAAHIAELAGAETIVCHLREDRRHINDRDVRLLRETIKTRLDLEMAATEEIISIALEIIPDLVTLVPERRQELTTESGLDIIRNRKTIQTAIQRFHKKDIAVSLFLDPVDEYIRMAHEVGADYIEIHTGEYANARTEEEIREHIETIRRTAELADSLGLRINAGHGLNYTNIKPIAKIPQIEEVSIGHAIISRAVFTGLEHAVREMAALVQRYSIRTEKFMPEE